MVGKRLAVVLLSLLLCLGAGTANATFPGINGDIAFVSNRAGNFDIYKMGPEGGNESQLTTSPGDERNPSWSPEGLRIAYDRDAYIHVLAEDAWDVQIHSCFYDSQPSWSPDGQRHVLYRQYGKTPYLLTRHINGTDEHGFKTPAIGVYAPEWSPDGTTIVFENDRYGVDNRFYSGIWIMDADGSNPRAVTDSENNDSMPSWHPDSKRIAFASARDGNLEIYVVKSDGTGLTRLTNDDASDFDPVWSPDGTKIAFISNRDRDHEVFVMDADGTDVTQLTNNHDQEADPDWQAEPTSTTAPGPPEGPVRPCTVFHERTISLDLEGHLVGSGQVTTEDQDASCSYGYMDVSIQRRRHGRWVKVAFPQKVPSFRSNLPDKPGRYRAVVKKSESRFYTDRYVTVCSKAISPVAIHKH